MSAKTQKKSSTEGQDKNEVVEQIDNEIIAKAPDLPILGECVGDFDNDDISFDKFQLAQSVGPLSDNFQRGDWVIGGEQKIAGIGDDPLNITVMRLVKSFIEDLPYGGDEMPRTASTKEEVYAMKGTLKWSEDENGKSIRPTWKPLADAFVCIEAPEGMDSYEWFPYRFRDPASEDEVEKNFAFAQWTIRNTAYRRAVEPMVSASKTYMRSGLMYGSFKLTSDKVVMNGNQVAVPKIGRGAEHSRPFVQWLSEFI